MIRRPRCGLADYEPNRLPRGHQLGNRRRRRYVLQGQKWAKTYLTYKYVRRLLFLQIDPRREQREGGHSEKNRFDQRRVLSVDR